MRTIRSTLTTFTLATVVLAVYGCDGALRTSPIDDPTFLSDPFTTDATTYTAAKQQGPTPDVSVYQFRVVAKYTNATSLPIRLPSCAGASAQPIYAVVYADQLTPQGIAYNAPAACASGAQSILVPPGTTREDTFDVKGPNTFDAATGQPTNTVVQGRFRIFFSAQSCTAGGKCVAAAESQQYSTAFTVKLGT